MRYPEKRKFLLAISAACVLTACSSGAGDGGIASAPDPLPSPTPSPTPTPTAIDTSVELVAPPATQEFVVVTRDEPIRIRYDAEQGQYEVMVAGADWSEVILPPDTSGPGPNEYFQIAGQPNSQFSVRAHNREQNPAKQYQYSNLAMWSTEGHPGGEFGNVVAFGTATPQSGVPLSGSASFEGTARGAADIPNNAWGETSSTPLNGTVTLGFDFGAGTLTGSLSLSSDPCDCTTYVSLGTLSFSDTVFSRGSQTFSGSFATGAEGTNAFEGHFTGPGAEELIGSFTLPFMFGGEAHQASGAWIAKRGD